MASILIPGFLRWDGRKYVLDPDVEGPEGPIGPTGPAGPAATPALPLNSLQFNNNNALGGTANWTYEGSGRINNDGGYITLGALSTTPPAVGNIRVANAGGITNIISARDTTDNTDYNIVRYAPQISYFGGAGQYTNLIGGRVNVTNSTSIGDTSDPTSVGTGHVYIAGGAGGTDFDGNATPGGVVIGSALAIGFNPTGFGVTYGGGGNGVVAYNWLSDADDGNASSQSPTVSASPGSHILQWVNEPGRMIQFFRGNEKMRWGGSYGGSAGNPDGYIYCTTSRFSPTSSPKFGPPRQEFISRNRWFYHRRLFYEFQRAGAGTFYIARFDMADETFCTFHFKVAMARRTNITKAGMYEGRAAYRRTGGGAPTLVGSASYESEQETTAGDGVVFTAAGNEIWVYVTAADADPRNYGCVLEVMEIYPD